MFVQQFVREVRAQEENNALFLHEFSCIDTANVVISMLASAPSSCPYHHQDHQPLSAACLGQLPQSDDGGVHPLEIDKIEKEAMVQNFWRAFDTVLRMDPVQLREGVQEAVATNKQIATLGRML